MSTDAIPMAQGILTGLRSEAASPVNYVLHIGAAAIAMNQLLGESISINHDGVVTCRHCAARTRKRYGDGYCYACFKRLAACDLCVMSPVRCHYAAGTCREPAWGEAYCMQQHVVYLANSAGPKVGITKPQNLPYRWLDQGATQALVIMRTHTRHQAGCVEAALARYVSDRTDWRALVRGTAETVDLRALARQLRDQAARELGELEQRFPAALQWSDAEATTEILYPVLRYGSAPRALALTADNPVVGTLLGIKGQYLLLDSGVFNVRRHTSYHVALSSGRAPLVSASDEQLKLF